MRPRRPSRHKKMGTLELNPPVARRAPRALASSRTSSRGFRLLKAAGLTNDQRTQVLTLTTNEVSFEKVRQALRALFDDEGPVNRASRRKGIWFSDEYDEESLWQAGHDDGWSWDDWAWEDESAHWGEWGWESGWQPRHCKKPARPSSVSELLAAATLSAGRRARAAAPKGSYKRGPAKGSRNPEASRDLPENMIPDTLDERIKLEPRDHMENWTQDLPENPIEGADRAGA